MGIKGDSSFWQKEAKSFNKWMVASQMLANPTDFLAMTEKQNRLCEQIRRICVAIQKKDRLLRANRRIRPRNDGKFARFCELCQESQNLPCLVD